MSSMPPPPPLADGEDDAPTPGPTDHHYNVNIDEDLKFLTETGVIWETRYAQMGLDAIQRGLVSLEDCRDVPPQVRDALSK